ncbi:MAG: hypothetical protein GTO12_10575 [Proteobacteria bacterium]|nr:hypothetical protein [Pseudomonadota bacterium]
MEERNLNEGLKQEVDKLKSQVQRLNNIVWVVGILALIFGIGGGFGYKLIKVTEDKVDKFQETVNKEVERFYGVTNKQFDEKKGELEKFIKVKKNELDDDYVKYNVNVAFRLSDSRNKLLSGGGAVRTNTDNIGRDETWKIERVP